MDEEIIRILIRNKQEFEEMLKEIKDYREISFDTENTNLNPKFLDKLGFSISVDGIKGWYIPLNHIDIKVDVVDRFEEIIENKQIIIMHNSVYDAGIVTEQYKVKKILIKFWFDTMIAQHLLNENDPKGLKYLTKEYFNYSQTRFEEMLKGISDYRKITAEQIYKYACDDAIYTFKLYKIQKEKLKEEGLMDLFKNIEMPFQKVLHHIRINGFNFDVEACKQFEKDLENQKKAIIQEIIKVTPEIKVQKDLFGNSNLATNIDSSKDLISLLYDKLNLPVMDKTEKGVPAVDTPTLKLIRDKHPIVPLLIKYKEVQKLLSAYTHSLYSKVMPDGRLYTEFLDHGTKTGRLSSRVPNLQQLPKGKVRSFFKASPGYKMLVADFSQEEIRVCGILTHSKTFEESFKDNLDLHLSVANDCYNLNIAKEKLKTNHPEYNELKDKFNKKRSYAKSINFGLMYGRTAHGLAPQLECSVDEAQEIVDNYFRTYPEIKHSIKQTEKEVKDNGFVRNMFGRKRRFFSNEKGFYNKAAFREAFNFKIQGTCGDMLRVVMNNLLDYINKQEPEEIRILGTVHDEVIFEIKNNERLKEHTNNIIDIMENSVKLKIPLKCDYDIADNYMEAK